MNTPRTFFPRFGRAWLVLAVACVVSVASAAGWSIQTIALRDYRDAQATATDLRTFGLEAYTEFAMNEGVQYVRVRIGCFATRESAEELAARLRNYLVTDAVPVERTPEAPTAGCVEERVGFLKPTEWRQVGPGVPAFEVTVAATTAVVRHTGRSWRMLQDGVELPAYATPTMARFEQGEVLDIPVVTTRIGGARVVVCPGTLLAEVDDVAIVEREDRVVACRLRPPSTLALGS